MNRSHKRIARMTGRYVPSDESLKRNILKRQEALSPSIVPMNRREKRYNRNGIQHVPLTAPTTTATTLDTSVDVNELHNGNGDGNEDAKGNGNGNGNNSGNGNGNNNGKGGSATATAGWSI